MEKVTATAYPPGGYISSTSFNDKPDEWLVYPETIYVCVCDYEAWQASQGSNMTSFRLAII